MACCLGTGGCKGGADCADCAFKPFEPVVQEVDWVGAFALAVPRVSPALDPVAPFFPKSILIAWPPLLFFEPVIDHFHRMTLPMS